jgi:hypothetical protein
VSWISEHKAASAFLSIAAFAHSACWHRYEYCRMIPDAAAISGTHDAVIRGIRE